MLRAVIASSIVQALVRRVFGGHSQFDRNAWCVCVCVCVCRDKGYEARGSTEQMRD
jgi:hypothetical protein